MSSDLTQLKEPVTLEDMLDMEEYIEVAITTQKSYFDRIRYQYQGDTWMSNGLWEVCCLLDQAHKKMAELRATNVFPRSDSIP